MNLTHSIRGALRRLAPRVHAATPEKRRTVALPSIFNSYSPRTDHLPKPTPANLRRFAETPVARKAINSIKDRIAGMRWRVQPKNSRALTDTPSGAERVRILTDNLDAPNPHDSFRSLAEQVLEDIIVGGFGAIEMQLTADPARPLALWPVDGASIVMRSDWDGQPDSVRYAQVLPNGWNFRRPAADGSRPANDQRPTTNDFQRAIDLRDNELSYIRLNPRSHTPFGLGRLEVAFESINAFLSAHRYASRLASNSVVQYALWLQDLTPAHHERLIRWWQDEIEGTGKVPILSAESKPEVLRFGGGTDADLRLQWQEFLLRVVADAFDLPPFYLGVERDVNRSTAEELNDLAFRQAIVPTAKLLAESLTRDAIAKKLGWNDLEFVFADVETTDPLEEAQIQQILLQNGVLTVN